MFHRCKQIRTQTSLFLPDSFEVPPLQQPRKETLGEILRLLWSNTLSPYEAVNRSPISAAKLLQRFPCCWRFALRLKYHAPMRGGKSNGVSLSGPIDRIPRCPVINRWHAGIQVKSRAKASQNGQKRRRPAKQML